MLERVMDPEQVALERFAEGGIAVRAAEQAPGTVFVPGEAAMGANRQAVHGGKPVPIRRR
jgi:hypothetical protein